MKKRIQVIFCSDFLFQVVQVLPNTSLDEAWGLANKLFEEHPEIGENYDVMSFDLFKEMDEWIVQQCLNNRKVIENFKIANFPTIDNTAPKVEHEVMPEPVDWNVPVCRTGWGSRIIKVKARSEKEAIDKAIDAAGDESFSENDAEYSAPDGAERC